MVLFGFFLVSVTLFSFFSQRLLATVFVGKQNWVDKIVLQKKGRSVKKMYLILAYSILLVLTAQAAIDVGIEIWNQ